MSIVIPAHDEERVLGRLLRGLLESARPGELDIVVVPNGCADATADVAASFGAAVRVVETPEASKAAALRLGDAAARRFPRLYVDADVELRTRDVRALAAALEHPGTLAAAPARRLAMTGRPWPVRAYYAVWTRLPEIRRGLFGRGVIAVGTEGHARLAALPRVTADDLAASLAFAPAERAVVGTAEVVVHPPRTFGDLLRRRQRAAAGTDQLEAAGLDQPGGSARTGTADLAAIARREPWLLPHLAVFLAVAVIARRRAARAGSAAGWQRDESSRG
ncbi:glycosyltransferase family 2 protein [Spirillospora sp. NPDC029432]|uniref:glycosyltransferase n=1 Tax=Spirillospora sp. NPDC029432 TaxID=3154599 RepID=UPI003454EF7B